MGLFDFFKPKKKLTLEQLRWNRMWNMWCRGEADSPYGELMTYQGDVSNGGHAQYFANNGVGELDALCSILPEVLVENLRRAYAAYTGPDEACLARCDEIFWENEERIAEILGGYAARF